MFVHNLIRDFAWKHSLLVTGTKPMTFWRNVNVISVLAHPRNFQDMLMKLFFSFAPFSTAWKFPDQKWLQQRRLQQWGWQKRWWCFHMRWLEKSCHLLRSSGFGLIQTGKFLLVLKLGTLSWFGTSALCSNNEYYFNQSVQIISWWMISQPIGMFLTTSLWICKGKISVSTNHLLSATRWMRLFW